MHPRRQAINDLKEAGFTQKTEGKNHTLYYNEELNVKIPLKRHDFDEDDLRDIRREINQAKENRWTRPRTGKGKGQ